MSGIDRAEIELLKDGLETKLELIEQEHNNSRQLDLYNEGYIAGLEYAISCIKRVL